MAIVTKAQLKTDSETGDTITQALMYNIIDTFVPYNQDGTVGLPSISAQEITTNDITITGNVETSGSFIETDYMVSINYNGNVLYLPLFEKL